MPFWKLLFWGFHCCFVVLFESFSWAGWVDMLCLVIDQHTYTSSQVRGITVGRDWPIEILETHTLAASLSNAAQSHFSLYRLSRINKTVLVFFILWMCIEIWCNRCTFWGSGTLSPLSLLFCSSSHCWNYISLFSGFWGTWVWKCTINAIFMNPFFPLLF